MITAEQLPRYQYSLAIDNSFSMMLALVQGTSVSRWASVRELAAGLSAFLQGYDSDGVLDGYIFSDTVRSQPFTPEAVDAVFDSKPKGRFTNLHLVIEEFGKKIIPTLANPGARHMLVVITDGEPTDRVAVARALVEITNHMTSDEQVAVGVIAACREEKTMAYLQTLDDELQSAGAQFDIFDWCLLDTFDGDVEQLLLNFVND